MASSPETSVGHLALASAAVGVLIHHIAPHQWASPTPCTDWPVRRVVHPLVGMNLVFAALIADEPMPVRFDIEDVDLTEQYDWAAELLVSRFSDPGTLDRVMGGPLGSASVAERLQIRLYDLLAHGWDLARATEQSLILPDDLIERSLAFATEQLDGVDRDGRFQPAQPCPDEVDLLGHLAAFLGRDIAWAAPRADRRG